MEMNMSADDVIEQIAQLQQKGESLNKKKVKQNYPELMKNALYYYPSWEHALQKTDIALNH